MEFIITTAKNDDRIRAVVMNGSRVDPGALVDRLSDFDIIFFVHNIQSFTSDHNWIERIFGPILIMQKPDDWFNHPYDYSGIEPFTYLMHFVNGIRLDLTLVDLENIPASYRGNDLEAGVILVKKDDMESFEWHFNIDKFIVKKQSSKQFTDTVNEFFWLATYVAKGIRRDQFLFVKNIREYFQAEMLLTMLGWSAGIDYDFKFSTGNLNKYLQKYLPQQEWQKLVKCLSSSSLTTAFQDERDMMALFNAHAIKVAHFWGFPYESDLIDQISKYLDEVEEMDLSV